MKLLLLTGIQEELIPLRTSLHLAFDRNIQAYRSEIYPNLFAATTGPGVSKRKEIRKLMKEIRPDVIVNAGLVGILQEKETNRIGERLRVGAVVSDSDGLIFPGGPGKDLIVTVAAPVFDPFEKTELFLRHRARACEMEAARILSLAGQLPEISDRVVIVLCKVAGDLPEYSHLFKNEKASHGWSQKSLTARLWSMFRFPGGPGKFRQLQDIKKAALASLGTKTGELVKKIIENQEISRDIDSQFIPH